MNINFEIKISEDEEKLLTEILHCRDEELTAKFSQIGKAALEEYRSLFTGQKIFTKTKDILEYRLCLLIKTLFNNEIPDEQQISDIFQTTIPESKSLLRAMNSKYQYELKDTLKSTLKNLLLSNDTKQNEQENVREISTNSTSKIDELNNQLTKLDGQLPKIVRKQGSISVFIIKPSSYNKLKEYYEGGVK